MRKHSIPLSQAGGSGSPQQPLTEHAALVAILCEGPELVFPHRITLVALPGELHHLREKAGNVSMAIPNSVDWLPGFALCSRV